MDRYGTEKIVHQVRYGLEHSPEKDFFFADGDIAFNRLVRDRMLLETKRRLPSIYPFVQSMYKGASGAWIYGLDDENNWVLLICCYSVFAVHKQIQ